MMGGVVTTMKKTDATGGIGKLCGVNRDMRMTRKSLAMPSTIYPIP